MTYYCGIDVGKRKHAVVILEERGQVFQAVFEVENTHAGLTFFGRCARAVGRGGVRRG